jgi:hypothetical protein
MSARPPDDPRVRAFLDRLAEAVANDLLGEIQAEQAAPTGAGGDALAAAEVPEPHRRAG